MPRVLVVDDEPLIAMALEAVLEDAGHRVATAANGRQALERLAEAPRPDLVLLDMMMPVMDGVAMLRELRARAETRETPVVLMSAAPFRQAAAQLGYQAALRKPFDVQDLLATLRRIVREASPR